ncbi:ATP-binding protein [Luteolibacter pohnpeiensis]|uniref:ATP-binding protein n=1 Tax=Luteolibacter pohnpeiensis TaxID=454153 RepID=A0A934S8D4_9BACT|nr:ATP-binding protein [Luteolibacter pohnpeiensis]MBK1883693.1 ATP-binding protein [Luteolibacter pohnpeiensis]
MSSLSKVTKGIQRRPHFVGLYGPGGVGKSSFGASAPNPIFIGTDDGLTTLDVAKFPIPKNWAEVKSFLSDLLIEDHEYESVVIDTVNGLEPLLFNHIIKEAGVKSIEEVDGGFGKGYVRAEEQWVEFFNTLKRLRNKMNVIVLGHAKIKSFEDPYENERFDKFIIKMNERGAGLFHESVDNMFFANFKIATRKEKGSKKAKAFGEGHRVMFTEERPAFTAKSRFDLPFEMPLSWDEFAKAAAKILPIEEATEDKLVTLFKGREDASTAYLTSIEWLVEGQDYTQLLAAKRKKILARPDDFIKAVDEFAANQAAEQAAQQTSETED